MISDCTEAANGTKAGPLAEPDLLDEDLAPVEPKEGVGRVHASSRGVEQDMRTAGWIKCQFRERATKGTRRTVHVDELGQAARVRVGT